MHSNRYLTSVLMPPVAACRYGCGSSCAAPVTVFWLFGMVSVVFGLLGGPTAEPGISWLTVGLGLAMWGIAAVWALLTIHGGAGNRCGDAWQPGGTHTEAHPREPQSLDRIKKAH